MRSAYAPLQYCRVPEPLWLPTLAFVARYLQTFTLPLFSTSIPATDYTACDATVALLCLCCCTRRARLRTFISRPDHLASFCRGRRPAASYHYRAILPELLQIPLQAMTGCLRQQWCLCHDPGLNTPARLYDGSLWYYYGLYLPDSTCGMTP